MKDNLYIVMPAYNEEQNIKKVINEWCSTLQNECIKSKIVVADKGSTDKTHLILKDLCKEHPNIIILDTKYKEHGPKLISLYKYAIANNAEYIFQTDSDGQTTPKEFKKFWEQRKSYDGIFGCRNKREDGLTRLFIEVVVSKLLRIYFGVKVQDANAPFRLMKASVLEKYIKKLPEDFNIPNIIITTFFEYYKNKNKYIDISFKSRRYGKNSVNFKMVSKIGFKALKDFWILKKDMRNNNEQICQ